MKMLLVRFAPFPPIENLEAHEQLAYNREPPRSLAVKESSGDAECREEINTSNNNDNGDDGCKATCCTDGLLCGSSDAAGKKNMFVPCFVFVELRGTRAFSFTSWNKSFHNVHLSDVIGARCRLHPLTFLDPPPSSLLLASSQRSANDSAAGYNQRVNTAACFNWKKDIPSRWRRISAKIICHNNNNNATGELRFNMKLFTQISFL